MENQEFIKLLEDLKNGGFIYNDADFCKKVGFARSHVSEMKAGKKPFTEQSRQRIEQTFPAFFADGDDGEHQRTPANADTPLLRALAEIGEQRKLVAKSQSLVEKNQEQIDRLLAIIEKLT